MWTDFDARHKVGHAGFAEDGQSFRLLRNIEKMVADKIIADPKVGCYTGANVELRLVRRDPDFMGKSDIRTGHRADRKQGQAAHQHRSQDGLDTASLSGSIPKAETKNSI